MYLDFVPHPGPFFQFHCFSSLLNKLFQGLAINRENPPWLEAKCRFIWSEANQIANQQWAEDHWQVEEPKWSDRWSTENIKFFFLHSKEWSGFCPCRETQQRNSAWQIKPVPFKGVYDHRWSVGEREFWDEADETFKFTQYLLDV